MGIALALMSGHSAQAQPSTFAYNYQAGSFSAEAEINPLAGRLLGRILKKEIPSALNFSATELAGSFTIPETTATLGNGSIILDSGPVKAFLEPYLQRIMGRVAQSYSLPEDVGIETLESVLNYRFIGQGLLESADDITAFTFEYGDGVDRLSIDGIDPEILALCQVQECNTQVEGDFDLKLDIGGLSETSDELGIKLPSSIKRALRRAQFFGLKEVAFADGQLTSVVQVLPNLVPPVSEEDWLPSVPEMPGSEVTVPEVAVPGITVTVPEIAVPEIAVPEVTVPAVLTPPITAPGAEAAVPGIDLPDVIPGVTQPGDSEAPVSDASRVSPVPLLLQPKVRSLVRQTGTTPAQAPSQSLHQLTHGKFVLSAERMTAPWSVVFSVPAR